MIRIISFAFTLFLVLVLCNTASGQIGGVSSGIINAINHLPIEEGSLDFEPNYFFTYSGNEWIDDGTTASLKTLDSLTSKSSLSLRIAMPLLSKVELGAIIANDFSSWSIKYALNSSPYIGYGLMAGLNLPFGTQVFNRNARDESNSIAYVFGGILSIAFNNKSSLDFNIQYQDYFLSGEQNPASDLFYFLDYSHQISNRGIRLLGAMSYQHQMENLGSQVLTFYPGLEYMVKENIAFAISVSFDVKGKNTAQHTGISAAWTVSL